jgi:hypothetical protein
VPVSPENAERDNLASIRQELAKVEARIDKELKAKYFGDNTVTVSIDGILNPRVLRELIKNYQNVGWKVAHKTSFHMNETVNVFKFSKKLPSAHQRFDEPRYPDSIQQLVDGGH